MLHPWLSEWKSDCTNEWWTNSIAQHQQEIILIYHINSKSIILPILDGIPEIGAYVIKEQSLLFDLFKAFD